MPEPYYSSSGRCRDCGERRADTKEREIAGTTVILCGECALDWYLEQRQQPD